MNNVWNALVDPSRRKILELLKKKDMTAGEIAANFDMSKPSISHHLSILKSANLINSQKKGQTIIYTINTSVLEDILSFIAGLKSENKKDVN